MKTVLLWLCRLFKIQHNVEKIYIPKWYPRPGDQDIVSILASLPFKRFMEHCQQKAMLMMLGQGEKEKRNELALIVEGVYSVESWAADWIREYSRKAEEEKISEENFNLSDIDQLAAEFDKRGTHGRNGN